MTEHQVEPELDEFLEIRKPGAYLDEDVIADDFVLMLGVDLENYLKVPRVDDTVTYPFRGHAGRAGPRRPDRAIDRAAGHQDAQHQSGESDSCGIVASFSFVSAD